MGKWRGNLHSVPCGCWLRAQFLAGCQPEPALRSVPCQPPQRAAHSMAAQRREPASTKNMRSTKWCPLLFPYSDWWLEPSHRPRLHSKGRDFSRARILGGRITGDSFRICWIIKADEKAHLTLLPNSPQICSQIVWGPELVYCLLIISIFVCVIALCLFYFLCIFIVLCKSSAAHRL